MAWLHLKFLISLAWHLWVLDCYIDSLGCLKPTQKVLMALRVICLYLPLDQRVVFSVARITGLANLSLRMWSS